MSKTMQLGAAATSVIVHDVTPEHLSDYEQWMIDAQQAHQQFAGYIATDVIRPIDQNLRYVVIVRFKTAANANAWLISDTRRELLKKSLPWLLHKDQYQVHQGNDFWFKPFSEDRAPKLWKQWLLSTVALFPLAIFIPPGLTMALVSTGIKLTEIAVTAISLAIISAIMVYWLMPLLTRLANKWLLR